MPRVAFADESGTSGGTQCYAIGVVSMSEEEHEEFNRSFLELKGSHGVHGEFKWSRIRNSHGAINLTLDVMGGLLRSNSATFDVIVVKKDEYRNWQGGVAQQERAFYQTYTQLLRHIARRARETAYVYIDNRSDSYPRHHEVIQTVGNRMLALLQSRGRLGGVERAESHDTPGIRTCM